MMETQLTPLFESILTTVKQYEAQAVDDRSKYTVTIKEKDDQIQMLTEIRDRQKLEMDDFLKVSFAHRWKTSCEEMEKKNS